MTGDSKSLDAEFAEYDAKNVRVRCSTCKLDPEIRAWAEAKVASGVPMSRVCSFLNAKGVKLTPSAMKQHFTNHVAR